MMSLEPPAAPASTSLPRPRPLALVATLLRSQAPTETDHGPPLPQPPTTLVAAAASTLKPCATGSRPTATGGPATTTAVTAPASKDACATALLLSAASMATAPGTPPRIPVSAFSRTPLLPRSPAATRSKAWSSVPFAPSVCGRTRPLPPAPPWASALIVPAPATDSPTAPTLAPRTTAQRHALPLAAPSTTPSARPAASATAWVRASGPTPQDALPVAARISSTTRLPATMPLTANGPSTPPSAFLSAAAPPAATASSVRSRPS